MTLCPYCNQFQPTTKCQVPHCGGFVCPCSGRCNREEKFSPDAHAALSQTTALDVHGQPTAVCEPGSSHGDAAAISVEIEAALTDLRWHWDEAYEIDCSGDAWVVRFRTDTAMLCAASDGELRKLIRRDYFNRTSPDRSDQGGVTGGLVAGNGERALRQLRDEGII